MSTSPLVTAPITSSPRAARKPFWQYLLSGVMLVVILGVTWIVAHTSPNEEEWQAAMPVTGEFGEVLTGRDIEATVHGVQLADEVVAYTGWAGPTSGVWVVVDASVAAVVTDNTVGIGAAELQVGSVIYTASDRPDFGSLLPHSLTTGIHLRGPLMFEIPRELLDSDAAASAIVRLGRDSETRLDSVIEVPVDLTALKVAASIETDKPVWGNE